jgi:hypothetical protein
MASPPSLREMNMKSFWIGGVLGFILGAGLAFLYFSLATLFSVHKKLAVESPEPISHFNEREDLSGESESENAKGVGA